MKCSKRIEPLKWPGLSEEQFGSSFQKSLKETNDLTRSLFAPTTTLKGSHEFTYQCRPKYAH